MKTHFAHVELANESDPTDYWSNTACGLEETESSLSNRWKDVDCKNCLKVKQKNDTFSDIDQFRFA